MGSQDGQGIHSLYMMVTNALCNKFALQCEYQVAERLLCETAYVSLKAVSSLPRFARYLYSTLKTSEMCIYQGFSLIQILYLLVQKAFSRKVSFLCFAAHLYIPLGFLNNLPYQETVPGGVTVN